MRSQGTIADPEVALSYFTDIFNSLENKHAPFKKYRVKRLNPWLSPEIAEMLRKRDIAWTKVPSAPQIGTINR